ncbi:ATP-dependent 6-phosphofructokinase [Megamonas hypermegale]|uniref:ATP-dependent 6-phosphofructokinase n=1 Tax=Megamonas hypermegale TaxID=158847 RepID=A0A239U4I0_9FIRM|nr:ATP-dependent 6-phosphofructokinase [Megamonas hypermegale]SNV04338.1 6-phosphofructokinase [Megamonas hypermegale]
MDKNIAVLTSGTDAPGMNAAIRAVVRTILSNGSRVWGVYDGYRGLVDDNMEELSSISVADIIQRGGTFLGTSFCKRWYTKEGRQTAYENLKKRDIDALIVIGGDGSLRGAEEFARETGFPVIGIPATIENDIWGTDYAIGCDTAANTILEAINKIRDTAAAHHRIFILEVMGNKYGWLATYTAVAGGGNMVIVPDDEYDQEKVVAKAKKLHDEGKTYLVILASEGVGDMQALAKELQEKTGVSTRLTTLGLVQRGGSPTANDRVFASVLGEQAALAAISGLYGIVFGLNKGQIVSVDLRDAVTNKKVYPEDLKHLAEIISY